MNQGSLIADLLAPFAEAASVRLYDTSGTLRKRILVSLHFADAERVHATLFPDEHLDWTAVRAYLASEASTNLGAQEWVRLITLLRFVAEPPARPQFNELLTAIGTGARISMQGRDLNPVESLQLCFARAGAPRPSWDTLCKTLLLVNITDIDASAALAQLFAATAVAELPTTAVEAILKHLPSACRHSRDDYSRTFAQLLGNDGCHVASHLILQSIRHREEAQERARQNHMAALRSSEKPSLTRILQAHVEAGGAHWQQQQQHQSDGLRLFCHRARLPGNLHHHLKLACYYMAMMLRSADLCTRVQALRRLTGDSDAVFLDIPAITAMLDPAVPPATPEAPPVREFILAHMQHVGPPCAALQQFRVQCMPTGGALSWTLVLRFYLAAYCPPPLNKDVWDRIVRQLLSTSNATNNSGSNSAVGAALLRREGDAVVQTFVRSTPPAVHDLVDLIVLRGALSQEKKT